MNTNNYIHFNRSIFSLFFLILLVNLTEQLKAQPADEIEKLKQILKSKIKQDALKQDSNLILFTLPLYVGKNSNRQNSKQLMSNDRFMVSTRFCHSAGFNLRFYVLSSNTYHNDASLKIFKSGKFTQIPETFDTAVLKFFHEVVDSSGDLDITCYDYSMEYYEEFQLALSLARKEAGCAIVTVTVYPQKR